MRRARIPLLKRQEGFTLNETLIAVALIAIGILGFSLNTAGVIQGNRISSSVTIATNLAQAKLEEIKAQTTWTNVTNAQDPNNLINETGASGGRFRRTWTIKDPVGLSNLKEISVQVSWEEYGIPRQVELATLIYTE
ncbi:MAG: prepilin-type N-terminal cleavage/methylation domain-containing protein [Deltaproteobacteria bacterium]|nr:prepilin-type N-terminal cleavage/methylation domain-containing protein [Deltaproteobacteria bacterium]